MYKDKFLKHLRGLIKVVKKAAKDEDIPASIMLVMRPDKDDLTPEIKKHAATLEKRAHQWLNA